MTQPSAPTPRGTAARRAQRRVRAAAPRDADAPVLLNADRGALEWPEARAFDKIGHAYSDVTALLAGRRLARCKTFVVDLLECHFLALWVVATVVDHRLTVTVDEANSIWHLLGLYKIAPPHFGTINAEHSS
jgi:hypothetical protein